jgi:trk system potassium uptake protein TrkA
MKYIVIGLGNYGSAIAEGLSRLGHEVVGVDTSENRVEAIKDKIATAFIFDASDELSLNVLPLDSVDAVIVSIGENFGASVRVTAMLKQRGVKHIYARAIDSVHRAILEGFGIDRILTPEEYSAKSLVDQLGVAVKMMRLHFGKD